MQPFPRGPSRPRVSGAAGASQTPPPPTPRAEAGLGLEAGTGPAKATELVMAERGRGCGAQRQTRGARPRKRRLLVRAAVNETVRGVLGLTLPVISGKRVCAFGVYCVLPPFQALRWVWRGHGAGLTGPALPTPRRRTWARAPSGPVAVAVAVPGIGEAGPGRGSAWLRAWGRGGTGWGQPSRSGLLPLPAADHPNLAEVPGE